MLNHVPVFGDPAERMLAQIKEGVKAGLHGGMLFEELGIRYVGPIDGHDIGLMCKYSEDGQGSGGARAAARGHRKRPRLPARSPGPRFLPHATRVRRRCWARRRSRSASSSPAFTNFARDAIGDAMRRDERVTVMTAAMCQGNKLEPVREEFPERFFRCRDLRIARSCFCRRSREGWLEADRYDLQHFPAA